MSTEVDHGEDEIKGFRASSGVRVGEGESVLDHAGPGANRRDAKVVFGGHGSHGFQIDEFRTREEEFDGVKA